MFISSNHISIKFVVHILNYFSKTYYEWLSNNDNLCPKDVSFTFLTFGGFKFNKVTKKILVEACILDHRFANIWMYTLHFKCPKTPFWHEQNLATHFFLKIYLKCDILMKFSLRSWRLVKSWPNISIEEMIFLSNFSVTFYINFSIIYCN